MKAGRASEEIAIGYQNKGNTIYIPGEILLKPSPVLTSQMEMVPHKPIDLAKKIARQNAESAIWLLLAC